MTDNTIINQVHQLPQEINEDLTIKYGIPVRLLVVVGIMFLFARNTVGVIYSPFEIAWYIWNMIIGIILCTKTRSNRGKSLGYSLMLFLVRDRGEYKSIDNPKEISEMKVSELDETPDKIK